MVGFRRRFGRAAVPFVVLWATWEVIDIWGNVVFVTEGGRWDWLPETQTLLPLWRTLVIIAALVVIGSYAYDRFVSRTPEAPGAPPPKHEGTIMFDLSRGRVDEAQLEENLTSADGFLRAGDMGILKARGNVHEPRRKRPRRKP